MTSFDVLVIGGGPAGAAASLRLARLGYSVCLTDAGAPQSFKIGESLPPAVKPLLEDLGARDVCDTTAALPSYGNQSCWGDAVLRDTDFINDPRGSGWHVDRARFDAALRSAAAAAGVAAFLETRVSTASSLPGGRWRATLNRKAGAGTIDARWIVDCGGRAASFLRSRGVKRKAYDRLIAIAGEFASTCGADADSRTLVESVAGGWWYTSLVPGNRRVAVFHTDSATAACRLARTSQGFLSLLSSTRYVRERLAKNGFTLSRPLHIFSANTARVEAFSGPAWIAAGDAALSFDPLSSQGILTALYSGLKAADAIHDTLRGDGAAFDNYEIALTRVFDVYLRNRNLYYSDERRWTENPFWRNRR